MTAVQTWSIISRGLERNLNSIRVNLLYTSASNMPHGKTDFFVVSNFFTYKKSPQPMIFVWDFKTARTRERLARQVATNKIVVRDRSVVEQFQN
jgi:hypothetical protein